MADQATIDRIGGLLKTVYGGLETQFNRKAYTYDVFEKSTERIGGDHFEMGVRVAGNTSGIGARNSDDPTPKPGRQNVQKFKVYDRMLEGVIAVFEKDIANSNGTGRAFVNHLDDEIENMVIDLARHQGVMVFGDGTGTLAIVNADTNNSANFVAKTGTAFGQFGVKYLAVGDNIDIFSPDFVTHRNGAEVSIIAIDPTTQAVTLSGNVTLTAGDVIVRAGSANKEYQGLYLITDNSGSVNFQGLSRATYPVIRGNVIPAGGNALAEDMLQNLLTSISARSGKEADLIVASDAQLNQYVKLGVTLKRYTSEKLDRGFTSLEYMGTELKKDILCPPSMVFALAKETVKNGEVSPLKWSDQDGHVLKFVPGYLKYTAVARQIGNWLATLPAATGRIDGLAVPNASSFQF